MCKGVIEITQHCEGEFISTIFIRAKKDGSQTDIKPQIFEHQC